MNYRRRKREYQHEEAHSDEDVSQGLAVDHDLVFSGTAELVETQEALERVIASARASGEVAYDTEFIGEENYYPRICLVQLGTTEMVALIDPVAVDDMAPVWELLTDPSIRKIVHAGSVDLKHVQRETGISPENVIDTQIASALSGLPWPVGLARSIESFCGKRLGKGHTFTNWDARPLSKQQLRYAADDVRYLSYLWSVLRSDLEQRGTLDWALKECATRLAMDDGFDPDPQSRRASKGMHLKPRAQAILRALVLERDRIAREEDRPHRVVMPDTSMLEIIRRKPTNHAELAAIRGFPRPIAERWHEVILGILANADDLEIPVQRNRPSKLETGRDQVAVDALWTVVCTRLLALGVAPGIVLSRSTLASWYIDPDRKSPRTLFPEDDWRQLALGEWLEGFLNGDRELVVAWGSRGALVGEAGLIHDGTGVHGARMEAAGTPDGTADSG